VTAHHTVSRPFTVLVVDDQPIIIEGVRRLLAVLPDAKLETCMKATEALARAKALKPAVILQDIHMPDGDGLELVERYRWETELAESSVIVLSAEENAATKADAFARGADDYLVKLPPPQEFVARVQHHADVARAQRERAQAFRALERAEHDLARQNALLDEANARLAKDNRELVVDVDTQRERLDRIARLSAELARVQDLDILLERILREAVALAASRAGAVLLLEKSQQGHDMLRAAEVVVEGVRVRAGECVPLDATTVAGEAMISGDVLRLGSEACALAGKGTPPIGIESILSGAVQSALVVPIVRARDRALGALVLVDGHSGDESDGTGFDDEDERLVGHFASLAAVAIERAQLVRSMILRMIAMAELRDPTETAGHVARVADLSVMLYDHWLAVKGIAEDGVSTRARDALRLGALLHDVGKVGISDAILKKPGKLDDAEFAEMKRHTEIGAQLFAGLRTDFDESAAEVALAHHERWDGKGYPRGLAGESIPIFARIVAVADVFDALSSKRAYKDAWTREKITSFFREEAGKHFDPTLADILVAHQSDAEAIRARHEG
jgi:response regulator RpfG family c-di-GMP phosphodiesterase